MRFKGEKTERVTLKERTVTPNDINENVEDWDSNDEPMYMQFDEWNAKEGASDGQVLVIERVKAKSRYKSKLDPNIDDNTPEADFRIQRGTTIYDIEYVQVLNRKEGIKYELKRRS